MNFPSNGFKKTLSSSTRKNNSRLVIFVESENLCFSEPIQNKTFFLDILKK